MPLDHNVIRQTQPQTRPLPSWFGGEKRLEDFVFDGFGNAVAVVLNHNQDLIVNFLGGNGDGGHVRLGTREGCPYGAGDQLQQPLGD